MASIIRVMIRSSRSNSKHYIDQLEMVIVFRRFLHHCVHRSSKTRSMETMIPLGEGDGGGDVNARVPPPGAGTKEAFFQM